MQTEEKKCKGLYTFTYFALGSMVPLISQYLASIGFSGEKIGEITATGTMVAIFANFFWGKVYTNTNSRKKLLVILCFTVVAMDLLLSQVSSFYVFLPIFGLLYFFQAPIMSLSDAMTLDKKYNFGQIRLWGAVGFACGVFIAGHLTYSFGLIIIFPLYGTAYFIAGVILLSLKGDNQRRGGGFGEKKKWKHKNLLPYKKYFRLLLCAFFVCGTNVANNTYFSFLYIKGGGTLVGVGFAFFLMAGSEIIFMAWISGLTNRFSLEKTIFFAMVISVFRFTWYGFEPSYILLLITFLLQGMVNGIILVGFVQYINKLIPKDLMGIGIGFYYSFSSGVSTVFCQWAGGWLLDGYGVSGVYYFFAVFNAVGTALYVLFGLYRPGQNKNC